MTPALGDFSNAVVATFVVGGAIASGLAWLWRVRAIAIKARDDLAAHIAQQTRADEVVERRLQKVEAIGGSVERLADAVKYGAEATATSIGNLAEKVAEHAAYAKERFTEISAELKHVSRNASSAKQLAERQSGRSRRTPAGD